MCGGRLCGVEHTRRSYGQADGKRWRVAARRSSVGRHVSQLPPDVAEMTSVIDRSSGRGIVTRRRENSVAGNVFGRRGQRKGNPESCRPPQRFCDSISRRCGQRCGSAESMGLLSEMSLRASRGPGESCVQSALTLFRRPARLKIARIRHTE